MDWLPAALWGTGGALISIASDYSKAYRTYRIPPWKVPASTVLPGASTVVVAKARYYLLDGLCQVAVAALVNAALSLCLSARYPWADVAFLFVGAGGVRALQRALGFVKLVGGPALQAGMGVLQREDPDRYERPGQTGSFGRSGSGSEPSLSGQPVGAVGSDVGVARTSSADDSEGGETVVAP
jgi:hypothetical protein